MDKFIKSFRTKTLVSIFFLFIISLTMLFLGFETTKITGKKTSNNRADFIISNLRFYLIPINEQHLNDINDVKFKTDSDEDWKLNSAVFLISDSTKTSIVNSIISDYDMLKRDIFNEISFFIKDQTRNTFELSFYATNIFLWIGSGLFLVSLIWLLYLPKVIRRLENEKDVQNKKDELDLFYLKKRTEY